MSEAANMDHADTAPGAGRRFWGKYRGTVLQNNDLTHQGRIIATVTEVLGAIPTGWAMPCAPVAGLGAGFYSIPPIGSGVWIEFEAGDVSRPIWTGGYWAAGETPPVPPLQPPTPVPPTTKVWRSDSGLTTSFDDLTQTIELTDISGLNTITISALTGTVTIKGLARVVLDGKLVQLGGDITTQPAVWGAALVTYLTALTTAFNTHMHPGQIAAALPLPPAPLAVVSPMPPVPPMPPPVGFLSATVSLK